MKTQYLYLFALCLFFTSTVQATVKTKAQTPSQRNVILFMWDGVRWDEFFKGTDSRLTKKKSEQIFKNFWNELLPKGGRVFGNPEQGSSVLVSNPVILSLPAYQNIFAGYPTTCLSNQCASTHFETFAERLVKNHGFNKYDVAAISSWKKIAYAVEKDEGTLFLNTGQVPLHMNYDGTGLDPVHEKINADAAANPPKWANARLDKYTFAHAKNYIAKQKPRFLFISMDDSDEYGHRNNYSGYVSALKSYDQYLKELVDLLESMGEYGKNTTLIVTTDHGRGRNPVGWQHHGPGFSYARNIFMYERNFGRNYSKAKPKKDYVYITHSDIRPHIEKILGVDQKDDELSLLSTGDAAEVLNTPYKR